MLIVALLRRALDYTPIAVVLAALYFDLDGMMSRGGAMLMMFGGAVWGLYLASVNNRCSIFVPAFIGILIGLIVCAFIFVLGLVVGVVAEVFDDHEGVRWLRMLGRLGYITYWIGMAGLASWSTERRLLGRPSATS